MSLVQAEFMATWASDEKKEYYWHPREVEDFYVKAIQGEIDVKLLKKAELKQIFNRVLTQYRLLKNEK
jgi:hypothetical protein